MTNVMDTTMIAGTTRQAGPINTVCGMTNDTSWHVALLGGMSRSGPWRMRPKTIHIAPVGGAKLDLTEATLESDELSLTKISIAGGVTLTVPADLTVEVHGFTLIGGRSGSFEGTPGGPVLHVHNYGLVGGVSVNR
jgi:hypothetical protein